MTYEKWLNRILGMYMMDEVTKILVFPLSPCHSGQNHLPSDNRKHYFAQ